jgi:hypothetical protein
VVGGGVGAVGADELMSGHAFVDPISGAELMVVIDPSKPVFDAATVPHAKCATPARVSADLDAFYCGACSLNGRISGAWVLDLIAEARRCGT